MSDGPIALRPPPASPSSPAGVQNFSGSFPPQEHDLASWGFIRSCPWDSVLSGGPGNNPQKRPVAGVEPLSLREPAAGVGPVGLALALGPQPGGSPGEKPS